MLQGYQKSCQIVLAGKGRVMQQLTSQVLADKYQTRTGTRFCDKMHRVQSLTNFEAAKYQGVTVQIPQLILSSFIPSLVVTTRHVHFVIWPAGGDVLHQISLLPAHSVSSQEGIATSRAANHLFF